MNLNRLFNKYLTAAECKGLDYKQKCIMLNYTVKQLKADRLYEKKTGKGDPAILPDDLTDIGDTINSLPMSDRQKEIARYRYLLFTIDEISQLMGISMRTVNNEIASIKAITDNNRELLVPEHDIMHKKVNSYNE